MGNGALSEEEEASESRVSWGGTYVRMTTGFK